MPLIRRMPHKRGFTRPGRVEYTAVNLESLSQRFEAHAEINGESLAAVGLLKKASEPFKILAGGGLDRPLTVRVARVSAAARAKIEAAGGRVEELDAADAGSEPD